MIEGGSVSRAAKKTNNSTTIVLLILVIAAIGVIGYYGFIETGVGKKETKSKVTPIASPSPAKATSSPPSK